MTGHYEECPKSESSLREHPDIYPCMCAQIDEDMLELSNDWNADEYL